MRQLFSLPLLVAALMAPALNAAETPIPAPAPARIALPKPLQNASLGGQITPDPRVRQYLAPRRVLWVSPNNQCQVEKVDNLLQPNSGQITLDNPVACTLRHQGRPPSVLLDFGVELQGGVQILVSGTHSGKPVELRVRFGESASEAMSELGGEKNTTNDHAVRDQTCLVPWLGSHEIGNTGFRFVRLDLLTTNSWVQLKGVRAIFTYRDLEYNGSFRCNDERLNKIWETGAYTVHLNMQAYVWDGIKRDRLVWIGDMHPETMTIGAVFGRQEVVPASLDLIRDETPLPKWMNGISSYSMWWVLIHHSWYQHHGDLAYLEQQRPYLKKLLAQFIQNIGPNNQENLPATRFLDWPSSENKPAIHAGLHALLLWTLQAGAELCQALNEPDVKQNCLSAVERLKKHVPDHGNSKQAAALLALSGLGDPARLNREVMAVDGAKRMSTFYGYYVLQARAKAGDYQGCLDCIRAYWGAMLDLGATTFWEDFDLEWTNNAARIDELVPAGKKDVHGDYGNYCYKGFRHSLCHGWASGPTAWMTEHVLGIQIVEPGCKTIRIQPHLGDLQWAEGSFPTPLGVLKVRHDKQADGSIESKVTVPQGIKIVQD